MTGTGAAEVFTNQPAGTVTTGGTTTSDTAFTVTVTSAFPVASATPTPNTVFRIVDVANTSEIMLVTAAPGGAGAGQSWTVVRGAEGTTAISHSANWTCQQIVSAGTLANFKQASNAQTSPVTITTSTTETVLASYQPVTADIEVGTTFEIVAYGPLTAHGGTARGTLAFNVYWGGSGAPGSAFTATGSQLVCSLVTNGNMPPFAATTVIAGASFDVNGTLTIQAVSGGSVSSVHANLNAFMAAGAALTTAPLQGTSADVTTAGGASGAGPVSVSAATGPIILTAKWTANYTAYGLTAVAPLIYRAA